MSNFGIRLKVLKVLGEKTAKNNSWVGGEPSDNLLYPNGTKRIVLKFCPLELKTKKVIQISTIKYICDSSDVVYYNEWTDTDYDYDDRVKKIEKLKNKIRK
jgi:hypothetical protein